MLTNSNKFINQVSKQLLINSKSSMAYIEGLASNGNHSC